MDTLLEYEKTLYNFNFHFQAAMVHNIHENVIKNGIESTIKDVERLIPMTRTSEYLLTLCTCHGLLKESLFEINQIKNKIKFLSE